MRDFSSLQLAPPLAKAIAEMGYESMTPIQEQAIPVVLAGRVFPAIAAANAQT